MWLLDNIQLLHDVQFSLTSLLLPTAEDSHVAASSRTALTQLDLVSLTKSLYPTPNTPISPSLSHTSHLTPHNNPPPHHYPVPHSPLSPLSKLKEQTQLPTSH